MLGRKTIELHLPAGRELETTVEALAPRHIDLDSIDQRSGRGLGPDLRHRKSGPASRMEFLAGGFHHGSRGITSSHPLTNLTKGALFPGVARNFRFFWPMSCVVRVLFLAAWVLAVLLPRPALAQELVAEGWSQMSEEDRVERRKLEHKTLPGLVKIDDFQAILLAHGFSSSYQSYKGPARLIVSGSLVHPFSATVHDVLIRIGFFEKKDLARAWRRIRTSPLMLTQKELGTPMPTPSFQWVHDASPEGVFPPKKPHKLLLETKFRSLQVHMRRFPEILLMLDEYRLENPSVRDMIAIINRGGVVDHAALAKWALESSIEKPDWKPAERKRLIAAIVKKIRNIRPPLAQGDLHRINALMALINLAAKAQDLESLLIMERSVDVLMTSTGLTYYDAVREENEFELPIHKIRTLPSLQEFLRSFKLALNQVRVEAVPELVRLAYDPLDFRDAPPDQFKVSSVQEQAKRLLEPAHSRSVQELMLSVVDQPKTQHRLLQLYVELRHAPVISTLLHWLHEHPEKLDSLGVKAASTMGATIVPALLRRFVEPQDALERKIAKRMLLALPKDTHALAVAALRGSGAMLAQDATMREAIKAFESHEDQLRSRKADLLEESIFGETASTVSAVRRMSMLEDLSRITPKRIPPRHREIADLLRVVALQNVDHAPLHSEKALRLLKSLPFDEHSESTQTIQILVKAQIARDAGKSKKAEKIILRADPKLDNPKLRLAYSDIVRERIRRAIASSSFAQAGSAIREAKGLLPHDSRFEVLAHELFLERYWLTFVLSGLGASSSVLTLSYLFARWAAAALGRRRKRGRARKSLQKTRGSRQAALDATEQIPGGLSGEGATEIAAPIEEAPPSPERELAEEGAEASAPTLASTNMMPERGEAAVHEAADPTPEEAVSRSVDDIFDDELEQAIEEEGLQEQEQLDALEQEEKSSKEQSTDPSSEPIPPNETSSEEQQTSVETPPTDDAQAQQAREEAEESAGESTEQAQDQTEDNEVKTLPETPALALDELSFSDEQGQVDPLAPPAPSPEVDALDPLEFSDGEGSTSSEEPRELKNSA